MNIRSFAGTLSAAAILASPACRAKLGDLPNDHRLSANVMECRVDTTKVVRSIPRSLFGTNLEWFNSANGISAADGSVSSDWVNLAKAQGVENIRFPGGTLSDYYHWRDGIGPVAKRPVREHPTDSGKSANVFGTPEFLRFCSAVGARPLITVNAGTGTAEEAADWVAYCNQPNNRDRAADGLSAPANVSLWEVGNELYLPGNPTDKQVITVKPQVYAERFLSFASAMRKIDPNIKLIAIGTANSSIVNLPYPDWNETVLDKVADQADYYAVHNAYFPMTFGQTGNSWKDIYQSLWAAPEAVDKSLTALTAEIEKHEKQRKIEIAVTEWGALFSNDAAEVDQVKTMGTAVYLARVMQVFMGQPRVTLANYFKFTDRSFMGWVGYDKKPKVPYYVIQLFSQHFGTRLVSAEVDSPKYNVKSVGILAAQNAVPEITVSASLNDGGNKLYVNFVNRSWNTVHQVALKTGSFKAADNATTWTISAPGLTDHNGRDLPDEIPTNLYQEPQISPDLKKPISIAQATVAVSRPLTLPPYSIVTVEMNAKP
ncbi:MAG TPA: alpha-L-arabinofuranosidase C-terminal domain-containing protein [Opitutaceae bacterium]|nr:alpha-L-arabinofuranosidase C-terminal domain-containing protein [Opitutaceae bacterium]